MSQFSLYFSLGLRHVLDVYRVEYILFLIAISAVFLMRDWKRVIILILSFTLGYSLTYYLSMLNLIHLDQRLIEFLTFLTVFLTAVSNVFRKKDQYHIRGSIQRNFFLAFLFGLVHGFGFSRYLQGVLGGENPAAEKLLSFNLGLEGGVMLVIIAYLVISFVFISLLGFNRRDWVLVISSAIAGVAITMMFESKYW